MAVTYSDVLSDVGGLVDSSVRSLVGPLDDTVDCVGVALLVHSLVVYVSVWVKLSRVLNSEGYSSSDVVRERDSVYDSEFSLSDDSSAPLVCDTVNVRDPVLVAVLLLIPLERVSPLREGDMDDEVVPVCESPNNDTEFGPLRDIVDATTSVPVPEMISSKGSPVVVATVVMPSVLVNPLVNEVLEYQLEVAVRLSVPLAAVKKGSSVELVLVVSEPRVLEPLLGGGVRDTSLPRCGPLEIVTGDPAPNGSDATFKPNPKPPLEKDQSP